MNLDKIPFKIKRGHTYLGEEVLVFDASGTCVCSTTGSQFTDIPSYDCLYLLHTHEDCGDIEFGAHVSLNVLIVLKVGI